MTTCTRKSAFAPVHFEGETMKSDKRFRRVVCASLALLASVVFTPTQSLLSAPNRPDANANWPHLSIEVVSSAPDQVTGGDARLHIRVPKRTDPDDVRIMVNGDDQSDRFARLPDSRILSGIIDGLMLGENTVMAEPTGKRRGRSGQVSVTLVNHPITGPVFSGPHQEPFVCSVQRHGLGEPIVDNQEEGFTVLDDEGDVLGYSKDCSAETLVTYVYKSTGGGFKPYTPGDPRPADMAMTTTVDDKYVDYFVRWERGTINRFIYSIAMLTPFSEEPEGLDTSSWNGKLIYHFQGGVAIGYGQGDPSGSRMLFDTGLSKGYAIAYSTGTKTGTHYNLVLGGETALMVKERFIELYDTPVYTVGIGASGGGIQQYVYGQNHKGLIDAAIPVYSYPDMVTQAVHVGDCELLEFYMDTASPEELWETWSNRRLLEGLNASDTFPNDYRGGLPGNTECINGWRGLSPLVLNPNYGAVDDMERIHPITDLFSVQWTHFGDLVNIYGMDDDGYARNFWDNVGVQYGLQAVASGKISPAEFLRLNSFIGGWKNEPEMVQEGTPFYPFPGSYDPGDYDPWSYRNQVFSPDPSSPARRTQGNVVAMNAAYEAGLVFMGDMKIPTIDWRHYLEPVLDMHNSHQSFAARQRMIEGQGNADNQVIWFTEIDPAADDDFYFDQTPQAFEVIDQWMENIRRYPHLGVAGNKPANAVDTCFDTEGEPIAAGDNVWDGILNENPEGACTERFPPYSTSRIVAGGPFKGSIFKCELQEVETAIDKGLYGVWDPAPAEVAALKRIFPDGVCDFDKPDVGLPPEMRRNL